MQFSQTQFISKPKKQILFAGRLTPGKGPLLLFEALPDVFKKFKGLKLLIAGKGFLKNDLQTMAKQNKFEERIKFLNQVEHDKLLKIYSESLLTVIPSVWPEPFGRVALESISQGTPVVATNRGGLKEIIDDSITGYITQTDVESLSKNIIRAVNNNSILRENIRNNFPAIKKKFQEDNIEEYIKIYESLK